MMRMGEMMAGGGQMMRQKGEEYKDFEMINKGKELENGGVMMGAWSKEMTGRSEDMTQMMRGWMSF